MAALLDHIDCDIKSKSDERYDDCSPEFTVGDIDSCMLFIKPGKRFV